MRWSVLLFVVILSGCAEPEPVFLTGSEGFQVYVKPWEPPVNPDEELPEFVTASQPSPVQAPPETPPPPSTLVETPAAGAP